MKKEQALLRLSLVAILATLTTTAYCADTPSSILTTSRRPLSVASTSTLGELPLSLLEEASLLNVPQLANLNVRLKTIKDKIDGSAGYLRWNKTTYRIEKNKEHGYLVIIKADGNEEVSLAYLLLAFPDKIKIYRRVPGPFCFTTKKYIHL